MKTAILILAHRMKRCGELNEESLCRVNKAIEVFRNFEIDFIISSGWAYKNGCTKCIGDIIREHLVNKAGIPRSKTYTDINSRDTVGDAYFVKKNIASPKKIKRLYIVTSDYHVERTKFIFHQFYAPAIQTEVISANDSFLTNEKYIREQKSLAAFVDTFRGVDVSNDEAVLQTLISTHPYYNGEIFSRFNQTGK